LNGSRGLGGGVSKPQIPYRVDWCISFDESSTCGSSPHKASYQEPPEKELRTRNITFEPTLKVTKKCYLWKKGKAHRLEEQG
jgi:hypothetical protein